MLERLQKIIAHAGIASRRHAEQLILSGQVRVNGRVITELGTKADAEQDRIEAAGKLVENNERRVYIVLNKPPEVVSTLADPEGRKTLRNCLKGLPERVYPVGRLDYDASGLVFLTNDGDLAAEMLKDWSNLAQVYHVKIKGRLLMEDLDRLGRNASAIIRTVRQPDASRGHAENFWYEVNLQDSKKDILRRVLFAEKHPVEKLKRIALGPLTLEGLPQGRYHLLAEKELAELRAALKIKPKPRSSFSPRQENQPGRPQNAKAFIHARPTRPNHHHPSAGNRPGGRGKHGPRPSRPPSPNRLETREREAYEREDARPPRPGNPHRLSAPDRPSTLNRPAKWNQHRDRNPPVRQGRSNGPHGPSRTGHPTNSRTGKPPNKPFGSNRPNRGRGPR